MLSLVLLYRNMYLICMMLIINWVATIILINLCWLTGLWSFMACDHRHIVGDEGE